MHMHTQYTHTLCREVDITQSVSLVCFQRQIFYFILTLKPNVLCAHFFSYRIHIHSMLVRYEMKFIKHAYRTIYCFVYVFVCVWESVWFIRHRTFADTKFLAINIYIRTYLRARFQMMLEYIRTHTYKMITIHFVILLFDEILFYETFFFSFFNRSDREYILQ